MSDFGAHLQHLCYDFFNANFIGGYVMSERLPGNLQERLRELREEHGYSSKEQLADALGINRSTYGRIENGTTKTISSELLIKLAELYDVSADYILGISNTPEKTYYDVEELGLSVGAAKNLYSGKVDTRVVNCLLLNNKFALATKMMATYFSDSVANLLAAHNEILDSSYDFLAFNIENGTIPNDAEMKNLRKQIKCTKIPANKYELTNIEKMLSAAVKEIHTDVQNEMKDYIEVRTLLSHEIIEAVQKEAASVPNLKELPKDQKQEIITAAVKNAVKIDESIGEDKLKELDLLIEQVAPALMNLCQ